MQHATKMVMVPQDAYSSLISLQKQTYSPAINQMSNLDQDLQQILANPNLSTDAKYQQYASTFGRYQHLQQEHFKPPIELPAMPLPIEDNRLIDSLPKPARRKAKILLDHLKDNPKHIQWLPSGELVADGTPILKSSITDLIHHVTRNRPSVKPPTGAKEFENLLESTNVPKEALKENRDEPTGLGTSFAPTPKRIFEKKPRRIHKPPERFGTWNQWH